jgi:hypothetical protein
MKARYCSPSLGRFHSVDPVEGEPAAPQSWNRFTYTRNNPLTRIDPQGTDDDPTVRYAIEPEDRHPPELGMQIGNPPSKELHATRSQEEYCGWECKLDNKSAPEFLKSIASGVNWIRGRLPQSTAKNEPWVLMSDREGGGLRIEDSGFTARGEEFNVSLPGKNIVFMHGHFDGNPCPSCRFDMKGAREASAGLPEGYSVRFIIVTNESIVEYDGRSAWEIEDGAKSTR